MKKLIVICMMASLITVAGATTIQYTTGTPDFFGWTWKSAAVRFTVPADSTYRLDALDMCVIGKPDTVKLNITVWSDAAGPAGSPMFVLADQDWHESFGMAWNHFDLSFANIEFAPGTSFYAGYTTNAVNYADVGIFEDSHATSGRSSGINIHYGSNWTDMGGELYFKTDVTAVPEPVTIALLALGSMAIVRPRTKTKQE